MPQGKPSNGTHADKRLVSHKSKADQQKSAAIRKQAESKTNKKK